MLLSPSERGSERRLGSMDLLLVALVLVVFGGLLALTFSRAPVLASTAAVVCVVSGCGLCLVPVAETLGTGVTASLGFDWDGPHGPFVVGLDSLSAFFLLPVLVLSSLAAVYGGSYLYEYRARKLLGPVWFFFCMFVAGMILVEV